MIIYLCIITCQFEYSLWNVLTIQMHLTCRKDRIYNRVQAKKNEDLFRRASDDISKWRIIWRVQWHHWCRTFQLPRRKGRPVQEEWCQSAVSRPEEKFIVPSTVDGNIVGYKAMFVAWGFSWKEGLYYVETFASSKSLNTYMMSLMNILTFATRLKM